ncbi:hypothetical protein Taro_051763 [Colocasia esculenta]|uniref:Uncharacterized protein n=1 Tax=Colocasia esculenta TaxID=4460 RepID=A0A843XHF4_COLES|nr:hypothetical protein [Colocasia esculenta]
MFQASNILRQMIKANTRQVQHSKVFDSVLPTMRGSSMTELVVGLADMLSACSCSSQQSSSRACSGFLIFINLETTSSILCSTQDRNAESSCSGVTELELCT